MATVVPLVVQNVLVSGGQLVVIQTGVLSPGQPAGRPLIITIFSTPSSFARRKVFSVTPPVLLEGEGIAGAVQGAQGDIPAAKLVHPALPGRFGAEQFVQVDVGRAGPWHSTIRTPCEKSQDLQGFAGTKLRWFQHPSWHH